MPAAGGWRSFGGDSARSSRRCGVARAVATATRSARSAFARSATVSVHALKFGGEEHQPMGLVRGIPTNGGSPALEGKRTAKWMVSSGRSHKQYNPSDKSILDIYVGPNRSLALCNFCRSLLRVRPNCIASIGAIGTVLKLNSENL